MSFIKNELFKRTRIRFLDGAILSKTIFTSRLLILIDIVINSHLTTV